LFPLRQGADALEAVVAGHPRRTRGAAEHQPGDPRPDKTRRAGKPGNGGGALQDAAVGDLNAIETFSPSCPRLTRASTSYDMQRRKKDVDGRVNPGHDGLDAFRQPNARSRARR